MTDRFAPSTSASVDVAALEEVPLREVWRDEARDFTPWLAANPEHLAKALQMDLELEEAAYPLLEAKREAIESSTALELQWEPLEAARASRVAVYLDPADPADRGSWAGYRKWAIETLGELRRIFASPVSELA